MLSLMSISIREHSTQLNAKWESQQSERLLIGRRDTQKKNNQIPNGKSTSLIYFRLFPTAAAAAVCVRVSFFFPV